MLEKFKSMSRIKKILVIFLAILLLGLVLPSGDDEDTENPEVAEGNGDVEESEPEPEPEPEEEEQEEPEPVEEEESEPEPEEEEEEDEENPLDVLEGAERIEYLIKDSIGEETNMGETRVIDIQIYEEENEIVLELHGNESLTSNMTKTSLVIDSKDLSETIYKDGNFRDKEIIMDWYLNLIDSHGNEVVGNVLLLGLKPEDAEKINWDNITTEQFEDLTLYWKHPNIFN